MLPHAILDDCGLIAANCKPVHGGDINRAFCLEDGARKYFLKINDAQRYPGMFEKEARGLLALHDSSPLRVPKIIRTGICDQEQYLLTEWIESGKPRSSFWQDFGAGLAILHKKQQLKFGWGEDNYIGSLIQQNQPSPSWHVFYAEFRILPLVKKLFESGAFNRQDLLEAEAVCKKLEHIFPPESPSLLHGDLWSGNFMVGVNGEAIIFDPAVYCGHREMDLGMTNLFGGFDSRFYHGYQELYPLENGWQQRLPLTQLYPLLVHAVLFGGHYVASVRETLKRKG